jgi:hypothetical protein
MRLRLTFSLLAAALLLVGGCSKGPKSKIHGKVTLGEKNVAGTVVFIGADGKEITEPIKGDGTYAVLNLPKGSYKVAVRGMGGLGGGGMATPQVKDAPKVELPGMEGMKSQGVPPPPQYGDPNKSGITFEAGEGEQEFNIPLK